MSVVEEVTILRDLTAVFKDDKDAKLVENISRIKDQVSDAYQTHEDEYKILIKALIENLSKAQKNARRKQPAEAHKVKIANLEEEKDSVAQKLNKMERELLQLETAMKELSMVERDIKAKKEIIAEESTLEVPRVQHMLSLYVNVTKIRWDYDVSDKIEGHVSLAADIQPFSLDPKTQSDFFIANYLWDLME